ncbi:DHHC zinc finger domain protein [Dictyocaulus viviparus]|uniref:Palmitoyltransferase n=1 Tax=Dictyocaulus viviparus TaxID=29172 RepID=A0A0D8Y9C7_DICVI|nr:DHHC zinc finger domain protein [Dictyocaulus viviparus]
MLCHRPSGLQLLSYFLTFLLLPITCFSSVSFSFPIGTIGVIVGYVIVYAQNIFLTFYDISPDELIIRKKQGIKPVDFDPKRHEHVIENGFCNICQIHVKENTKHCRQCNVCVEVFDHHCIWLNNCIGKKNYKMFVTLIFTIVVLSSGVTLLSLWQIFFCIYNPEGTRKSIAQILPSRIPMWIFLLTSSISFASHFAITATTAHLLQFHIKLWTKGITTYRFLLDQRQKKNHSKEMISVRDVTLQRISSEVPQTSNLRGILTPKISDVHQQLPSYMQTEENTEKRPVKL